MGLATAAVVVLSVAIPALMRPSSPVVQLALLDAAGTTRGSDTNDVLLLREAWKTAGLDSFTNADAVREWETRWSGRRDTVRIIYDRAAAEVRVSGKWRGESFEKTFLVEPDLPTTLSRVKSFVFEQTQK